MAEKKTVLIPIADGVEDIETISVMDILTYAGMQVTIASLTENKLVKCANGTKIECNEQKSSKRIYAAICATPALVFQPHGLLDGEVGTCYPALADKLADQSKAKERVVVSNNCITSQAPGTTAEFAFVIVEAVIGAETAKNLKAKMQY